MAERYLRSIRLLAECIQIFEHLSAHHVRHHGLTQAQFDIIATLGNTPGMTCRDLGDRTLITKGTLTGVLDRLERKELVLRERGNDRRQLFIRLTPAGEALFDEVFPQVIQKLKIPFTKFTSDEFVQIETSLSKLKQALSDGRNKNEDKGGKQGKN